MKIQNLSVDIPASCPNLCPFCVARQNTSNKFFRGRDSFDSKHILKRMQFAVRAGCNNLLLTSTGEPLTNPDYVNDILQLNDEYSLFEWVELQTSGFNLLKYKRNNPYASMIDTIAISVYDLIDPTNNRAVMGLPVTCNIYDIIDELYKYHYNFRISMVMTKDMEKYSPHQLFHRMKISLIQQVNFKKLYNEGDSKINKWISENEASDEYISELEMYIQTNGIKKEIIPSGLQKYSVDGIGTVIDTDCMAQNPIEGIRSMILRPDGRLYTNWDDFGSLLF